MGMELPIVQSQWNGYRVDGLYPDKVLDVRAEPDYPRGREALHLSNAWQEMRARDIPGVLLLGCDVAADPDDYAAMYGAVRMDAERVYTGMVKLWPASTRRPEWMWSHRGGKLGAPEATQLDPMRTVYFSIGFAFIPRQLMDLAFPEHSDWSWGQMDVGLSELAYHHRIRVGVVYDAMPKHLHFLASHNR